MFCDRISVKISEQKAKYLKRNKAKFVSRKADKIAELNSNDVVGNSPVEFAPEDHELGESLVQDNKEENSSVISSVENSSVKSSHQFPPLDLSGRNSLISLQGPPVNKIDSESLADNSSVKSTMDDFPRKLPNDVSESRNDSSPNEGKDDDVVDLSATIRSIDNTPSPFQEKEEKVKVDSQNDQTSGSPGLTATDDEIAEKKRTRARVGIYRIGLSSFRRQRYVYLPSSLLKSPTFHMSDIFDLMGIDMPNILFRVFQTPRPKDWNVRLPRCREHLIQVLLNEGNESSDEEEEVPQQVKHYQGVLRENCKRLLRDTGLACQKAGAGFRVVASWNPQVPEDAMGGWITNDNKSDVVTLGCADYKHFHPSIWEQLEKGMTFAEEVELASMVGTVISDKDVIIDPEPFYNNEMGEITRDSKTNRIKGSFPHPNMSHLLISDNLELLEKKLTEAVPWGLIMVNGSEVAADYYVEAIHKGLPVILFQHTGYTTDIAVSAYKKAEKLMMAKKHNPFALAERAFPDTMAVGHHLPRWLKPFDRNHLSDCRKLNILLENWPSLFNEDSVFIVDMFSTTEDELQDKVTQTMGVVFGPQHEVGGHMSESKRITYAWRSRAKYLYNARVFKNHSDILNALLVIFTFLSTASAVVYTFLLYNEHIEFNHSRTFVLAVLLKANLLLPLVATLLRGFISAFNPLVKYIALKNAAVKIEAEIYEYRTKVGKYSFRKPAAPSKNKKKTAGSSEVVLPRIAFAKEMDKILDDLKASDVQHGSLKELPDDFDPLGDVNKRLRSNSYIQENYSKPILSADMIKSPSLLSKLSLGKPKVFSEKDKKYSRSPSLEMHDLRKLPSRDESEAHSLAPVDDVEDEESDDGCGPVDDGLTLLTADDYLTYRMLPMIAELTTKTPRLSSWSSTFTILVLILSVSAAALSTFERSDFIPAALALSGGITAWASYQQTDLRLILTNNSLSQLNQLLVWWDGLTMIEKRIPINKETLVMTSEMAILSQATVVGGSQAGPDTTSASSKEDDDDGNANQND